jgi:GNAT superfamily N-acetyltransferase
MRASLLLPAAFGRDGDQARATPQRGQEHVHLQYEAGRGRSAPIEDAKNLVESSQPQGASMAQPKIVVTDTISPDIQRAIGGGLDSFNAAMSGISDFKSLAIVVKDPATGEAVGGAIGRSSLGLLFLDLFYLPEAMRGSGLGTTVLRMFEDEGRRRGCQSAVLYTISFQAPGFYERNGWRRFGEVASKPGISRIFMMKEL